MNRSGDVPKTTAAAPLSSRSTISSFFFVWTIFKRYAVSPFSGSSSLEGRLSVDPFLRLWRSRLLRRSSTRHVDRRSETLFRSLDCRGLPTVN